MAWAVLEMEFAMALWVSPVSHPLDPKVGRGGMAPSSRLWQVLHIGKELSSNETSSRLWYCSGGEEALRRSLHLEHQNPTADPQAASCISALQALVWKLVWTSCLLKGMCEGAACWVTLRLESAAIS